MLLPSSHLQSLTVTVSCWDRLLVSISATIYSVLPSPFHAGTPLNCHGAIYCFLPSPFHAGTPLSCHVAIYCLLPSPFHAAAASKSPLSCLHIASNSLIGGEFDAVKEAINSQLLLPAHILGKFNEFLSCLILKSVKLLWPETKCEDINGAAGKDHDYGDGWNLFPMHILTKIIQRTCSKVEMVQFTDQVRNGCFDT